MQIHRTPIAYDLRVEFVTNSSHALAAPRPGPGIPGPIAQTVFTGTAGADDYTGAGAADRFDMFQGGDDVVRGRANDDQFFFGAEFTAADRIDGGADSGDPVIDSRDQLYINGDYSGGVVFGSSTVTGVEMISCQGSTSYNLTFHDNTVAAGQTMLVRGSNLLGNLTFNGAAETDGGFIMDGQGGTDRFTGGAQHDSFVFFTGGLQASDRIDGGGGQDSLILNGDYSASLTFGSMTMRNVELLELLGDADGNTYNLKLNDGNVFTGDTLNVIGEFMTSLDAIIFDGSAELDGTFVLSGAGGKDTLIGGWQQDFLIGGGGSDYLKGGPQVDHYSYAAVSDSTGNHYDTVVGFDFDATDFFQFGFHPSAIDPAVASGTLKNGNFNANLAAALDAAHLGAGHAVLFTPDAGNLAGKTFLVVDANGTAGYQANADFVMFLKSPAHLGAFDLADFA